MKKLLCLPILILLCAFSCHAQNGPTVPSVVLSWTQSTTTGVTGNCVYRSLGSGTTPAPPAIFCSTTAITTYTDTTVTVGDVYVYAVTALANGAESAYSATFTTPAIPADPNAVTSVTGKTQ